LTTAIIGVGSIGSALALDLTRGGEHVVLAARDEPHAQALANELGSLATAASAPDAIAAAEGLITAAGFEPVKAGGAEDAARIEVPGGDLHQNGGLNRQVLGLDEARAAVAVA
jgi:predicted dinucleotide-utilizing enzyme